jgi:hypothetical protein
MDEKPKRRWFRFRLSTVLILTAILAWGMASRPNVNWGHGGGGPDPMFVKYAAHFSVTLNELPWAMDPHYQVDNFSLGFTVNRPGSYDWWWMTIAPKALLYPVVTLLLFLAWKAAWAVIERRRARRPTHS